MALSYATHFLQKAFAVHVNFSLNPGKKLSWKSDEVGGLKFAYSCLLHRHYYSCYILFFHLRETWFIRTNLITIRVSIYMLLEK